MDAVNLVTSRKPDIRMDGGRKLTTPRGRFTVLARLVTTDLQLMPLLEGIDPEWKALIIHAVHEHWQAAQ